MFPRWSLLLLVLCASPCLAGKLYECRDAKGHRSYVDGGCPAQAERREIDVPAAAGKPATDADAKAIAAWDKASRARLPASLGGSAHATRAPSRSRADSRRERQGDACSSARAEKDRAYRERSFTMGFDERRRLSDLVLNACGLH